LRETEQEPNRKAPARKAKYDHFTGFFINILICKLQNYEKVLNFASELTTFFKMISKNQQKYIRQLELKKYRKREGLFVAEGTKVVGDLLKRYTPKAVFATSQWQAPEGITPIVLTDDELQRISFQQHPQQVLALFPIPSQDTSDPLTLLDNQTLAIALDGVQDPGNLGTIIRIADWFGIDTIYCSQDTADAWNPKVVQATMGSIARVNIIYTKLTDLLGQTSLPVYGTLLDGEDLYSKNLAEEGIIVMGNEGNGISSEVRQLVTEKLFIPCYRKGDTAESLNVAIATAITCAEFRRRK
jgi:TrmH family RNA methyltransferase